MHRAQILARRRATEARAWAVAQDLRTRRGWRLDTANVQRSWSVRLGAATFEISAFVSLFFDGPCVIQLTPAFPKTMPIATAETIIEGLRASLGERYRRNPPGARLATLVRTDRPKYLLAELAHVEHVLGGHAPERAGPGPRSLDRSRWHVLEALRARSWQIYSVMLSHKHGDGHRAVWASIAVVVESASRAGLVASFTAWVPRTTKRWTRFRDGAAAALAATGFHVADPPRPYVFHAGRPIAGLTRAVKQADELDELLAAGARAVREARLPRRRAA